MPRSKIILLLFLLILSFAWSSSLGLWKRNRAILLGNRSNQYELINHSIKKMTEKAKDAKRFVSKNNYDESACFLVDMSLPSGQNRFFVYDLNKDTIQNSGLVTHGRCNEYWLQGRKYGNAVGCGCTSLGKYKVGYSYNGKFGLAFKLYGLDKTNDKAFARFVVLHSHDCVPDMEVTNDICQSDGCPTVAPGFLQQLKTIINESKKPVLLWIYN